MNARPRRAVALSVMALAAGLALPVATGPAALAEPETDTTTLTMEVTDLAPAVLTPDEPLVVSGTVTNHTAVDLIDAELDVILQRYPPVSRTGAHQWLFGVEDSFAEPVSAEDIADLPAGESVDFTVEIAPEDLDLSESEAFWGPRGLEVTVSGAGVEDGASRNDEEDEDSGEEDSPESALRASDRTVTVWFPEVEVELTPVGVALPLVPLAQERADAASPLELLPPVIDEDDLAEDEAETADGQTPEVADDPTDGTTEDDAASEDDAATGDATDEEAGDPETTDQATGEAEPADEADQAADEAEAAGEPDDEAEVSAPMSAEQIEELVSSPASAVDRLARLLEAVSHPGVTLATDPALLAPAESGAPDAVSTPGPAATAEDLAAALQAHAGGGQRGLALLPWADADIAALTRAGAADLTARAYQRGQDAADAAGIDALPLIWPAGEADALTVDGGAEAGVGAALLSGEVLAPTDVLTYTPTGRVDLGEVETVLTDPVASDILTGFLREPGENGSGIELSALNVRQMLLSDLAATARERPSDPRGVLLALDREQVATLDEEDLDALSGALAVLSEAPWLELSPLADLLALPAPDIGRAELPASEPHSGEVDAEFLESLAETRELAETWSPVIDLELDEAVAATHTPLLSAAWRDAPEARVDIAEEVAAQVGSLHGGLTVLESSTLNVVSTSAVMPLNLSNTLPRDANVVVELEPSDPRLQIDEAVELSIPAQGQVTAQVPVRAVGSGDVTLNVRLLSPEGTPVGGEQELEVRVRADWETVGTAAVAGVLAVMLVLGLVRTVRRGRRMEPAA